jgi:hypothetical protein
MAFGRIRIRGLMTWIAVTAVVLFAVLRLDISSLPEGTIWGGFKPHWGPAVGNKVDYLLATYLAHWVIPAITVVVVWPHRRRELIWLGIGAIMLSVTSWVVLRRIVWPPIVSPYGVMHWPSFHLNYLHRSIASRSFQPPYPVSPFTYELFYQQKGDFLCLLALLVVLTIELIRPLPLRLLAVTALFVNLYKFCEWGLLMCFGRYWGPGDSDGFTPSSAIPAWVPEAFATPKATLFELVQGLLMIALILYLVAILLKRDVATRRTA